MVALFWKSFRPPPRPQPGFVQGVPSSYSISILFTSIQKDNGGPCDVGVLKSPIWGDNLVADGHLFRKAHVHAQAPVLLSASGTCV